MRFTGVLLVGRDLTIFDDEYTHLARCQQAVLLLLLPGRPWPWQHIWSWPISALPADAAPWQHAGPPAAPCSPAGPPRPTSPAQRTMQAAQPPTPHRQPLPTGGVCRRCRCCWTHPLAARKHQQRLRRVQSRKVAGAAGRSCRPRCSRMCCWRLRGQGRGRGRAEASSSRAANTAAKPLCAQVCQNHSSATPQASARMTPPSHQTALGCPPECAPRPSLPPLLKGRWPRPVLRFERRLLWGPAPGEGQAAQLSDKFPLHPHSTTCTGQLLGRPGCRRRRRRASPPRCMSIFRSKPPPLENTCDEDTGGGARRQAGIKANRAGRRKRGLEGRVVERRTSAAARQSSTACACRSVFGTAARRIFGKDGQGDVVPVAICHIEPARTGRYGSVEA